MENSKTKPKKSKEKVYTQDLQLCYKTLIPHYNYLTLKSFFWCMSQWKDFNLFKYLLIWLRTVPQTSQFVFFLIFYLFIHERQRDTGRGRAGSPQEAWYRTWSSTLGSRPEPRQTLNCWATLSNKASLLLFLF